MNEKKYLDGNGLLYYDEKYVKGRLKNKVDTEHKTNSESEYKVLSDNNLTDELVKKINDAGSSSFNGSYNNLTDVPTLDGTEIKGALTSEDLGLAKKSDIPTDYVSDEELEQKGYQTLSDVESTISSKNFATETYVTQQLANINKKEVVTGTEQMTDENTIYLLANSGAGNNIYDEYIVYKGTPEKIGTTEVNLTGYLKETDLVAISNAEIDSIVNPS